MSQPSFTLWIEVERYEPDQDKYYRDLCSVKLGTFPSEAEARAAQDRLLEAGAQAVGSAT